jgi:Flp pilus assembly protein TadG
MRWRGDRGSSVVEFVLVSTLLLLLLFGVMQAGLYLYARNVAAAAAADGARYAASAGMPADAGSERSTGLIGSALHRASAGIHCDGRFSRDEQSRLDVVTVRCSGRLRSIFAPLGAWLPIDVSGSALREATG